MHRLRGQLFFLVLLSLLHPLLVGAQPSFFYWDSDGAIPGAGGSAPSGVWDVFQDAWNTMADGAGDSTIWLNGNVAVFAAGTNATDPYTVTLANPVLVDAIHFEEGTVDLTGAEIDLIGNANLDVAAGWTARIDSTLGGAVGLTKTGAGTLLLGSPVVYSGATIISAGMLASGAAGVIPDNSAVSVASGAIVNLFNFTETVGSLAGGGNVVLGTGTLVTGGDGTSTTFSGVISGAGGLTKTGGGVLTLGGTSTYSGATTITTGTIRLGGADRLGDLSAVSVSSGASLNLNNFSETVGSLAGAGAVPLGSGTLSAGANNNSTTFTGTISGTGGLVKKGTGKLSISGTTSSYSGSTRIEAGTLAIDGTSSLGSAANVLDLAGGSLEISAARIITNQVTLSAASQLVGAVASGSRTLTFLNGTFNTTGGILTIRNTGTGGTLSVRLRSGGLNLTRPIVIGQAGDANNAATNAILRCDHQSGGDQIISGNISGPGIFERNSNLSLGGFRTILTGNNSYSGRTDLKGGFIGIGSDTALGRAPINVGQDPQLLGFFASGAARVVTNSLTFEAITAAATNLILSGSLPLTFTGPVALNPANVCRLLVSNGMVATFSGVISGTTGLEKTEANTLILSGANLYSGVTVVSGGTLLVNNPTGSGTGTSAVTVNSGTTLGGIGRLGGPVTLNSGSRISPGTNTGSMAVLTLQNGLNVSSGGTNVWELSANATDSPGVNFDQIALTAGNLVLGGNSKLAISFTGTATVPNLSDPFWRAPHSWTLISLSGTATNQGSTRFPTVVSAQYPSLQYFTNYADARGSLVLTYDPISPFYLLYDVGGGFFGGENFAFTNAAGRALYVWSSPTGGPAITNWSLVGPLGEQPLNDGSGNSRYSINLTPSASPTYYIAGRQTTGPYPATVPVTWVATDEFGSYTIFNANAAINAAGLLDLPAAPEIVQQPVSKTVLTGKNPAFSVTANSFSALSYQWYFNSNQPLAQGTNAALICTGVTGANAGNYRAVVANAYGSVTSGPASLTVLPLPQLTVKPIANGIQIRASAVAGDSYVLLGASNLNPPAVWLPTATNIAGGDGVVQFTDSSLAGRAQRYYRLQAP